jgi:large subunit ribosomal protein L23
MNQERLLNIIRAPVISEKSTRLAEKLKQFVFKVQQDANKHEVKEAVETLFSVKVKAVQITNTKGKRRNFRGIAGRKSDCKKAYVSLQEGYDINFAGGEV